MQINLLLILQVVLLKPIIRSQLLQNLKNIKTYSLFTDSICHAHLADVQLIKEYIEQI